MKPAATAQFTILIHVTSLTIESGMATLSRDDIKNHLQTLKSLSDNGKLGHNIWWMTNSSTAKSKELNKRQEINTLSITEQLGIEGVSMKNAFNASWCRQFSSSISEIGTGFVSDKYCTCYFLPILANLAP